MDATTPAIQIVATPDGEAPDWVRQAWIGLFLPPMNEPPLPVTLMGVDALASRNLTWWCYLWLRLTGKAKPRHGYIVRFDEAMAILRMARPDAAAWWDENAAHLTGRQFIFETRVCRRA